MRYYPYGTTRTASGVTPTDYGFTGQRADDVEADLIAPSHFESYQRLREGDS